MHWGGKNWWISNCGHVYSGIGCGATKIFRFYLRASRCSSEVYWHPYSSSIPDGHTIRPTLVCLATGSGAVSEQSWAVILGMHGIHCEHSSLIPPSILINAHLIHKWIYVCWDTMTHTETYELDEK